MDTRTQSSAPGASPHPSPAPSSPPSAGAAAPDDAAEATPQDNARRSREGQAVIARLGAPVRTRLRIGQVLVLLSAILAVAPYIALVQLGDILLRAHRAGAEPGHPAGVRRGHGACECLLHPPAAVLPGAAHHPPGRPVPARPPAPRHRCAHLPCAAVLVHCLHLRAPAQGRPGRHDPRPHRHRSRSRRAPQRHRHPAGPAGLRLLDRLAPGPAGRLHTRPLRAHLLGVHARHEREDRGDGPQAGSHLLSHGRVRLRDRRGQGLRTRGTSALGLPHRRGRVLRLLPRLGDAPGDRHLPVLHLGLHPRTAPGQPRRWGAAHPRRGRHPAPGPGHDPHRPGPARRPHHHRLDLLVLPACRRGGPAPVRGPRHPRPARRRPRPDSPTRRESRSTTSPSPTGRSWPSTTPA